MFEPILSLVSPAVSGSRTLEDIEAIWRLDRWCSFDRHHEASLLCESRLREAGVEAEIVAVPADGETRYGDWIMPQAWDARKATLRLLSGRDRGEVVLCDYLDEPCSLVIYSAPTQRGGVTADLICLDGGTREEDYESVDVEGKIILTRQGPVVKEQAVKHGAAGIITDQMPEYEGCRPHMAIPDARAWHRFRPDYAHGGWGVKKGDTRCWGFVLSPRQGERLRELARREGGLRLHAEVDARFYEGTIDLVMGWIPGLTREEVLVNGHLSEVGAVDNASGCGLAIEVLRALNGLIANGSLKRPRRGIRMIFSYECMGTMAAAVERKDIFRNLVAGVTLDCVGGREAVCRAPLGLYRNPDAQSSYTGTLLRMILERQSEREKLLVNWREHPHSGGDSLISDPTIGVPCPLLMECPYTSYHSSADRPEVIDPEKLAWIGGAVATYVYFIATAGKREALWLAEQVLSEGQCRVIRAAAHRGGEKGGEAKPAATPLDRALDYLGLRYSQAMDSAARLAGRRGEPAFLKSLQPLKKDLAETIRMSARRAERTHKRRRRRAARVSGDRSLVPERLVLGQSRMTRIPREDREHWKAMCKRNGIPENVAFSALLWADGKRSIAEIEDVVECETGQTGVRLAEFFRGLEKYGYVELHRASRRIARSRRKDR